MSEVSQITPIDPILISIGPIDITWYAFLIVSSFLIGTLIIRYEFKKRNISSKDAYDIAFYTILFGVIGARIYDVIFTWEEYAANPLSIIAIWNGGLSIYGGIIAGAITIIIISKRRGLIPLEILDIVVLPVLIGQIIGRWGNFFNQEVYGKAISGTLEEQFSFLTETLHLPDAIANQMYIEGAFRHPIFLYESVWNLFGVAIILILRKFFKPRTGTYVAFYLIWYGLGRIAIEMMKETTLMWGNFSAAIIVSIVMIIIGIILFVYLFLKKSNQRR